MKKILVLLIGLFLLVAGCTIKEPETVESSGPGKGKTIGHVPTNILNKFDELARTYSNDFGAKIYRCTKDNETIYEVIGSRKFSGVEDYYDKNGGYLGEIYVTDVVSQNDPKPPVDLTSYKCDIIRNSKEK